MSLFNDKVCDVIFWGMVVGIAVATAWLAIEIDRWLA